MVSTKRRFTNQLGRIVRSSDFLISAFAVFMRYIIFVLTGGDPYLQS